MGLPAGLATGVPAGLAGGIPLGLAQGARRGLVVGLAIGIAYVLAFGLLDGFARIAPNADSPVGPKSAWNEDRKHSLSTGLVFGLAMGFAAPGSPMPLPPPGTIPSGSRYRSGSSPEWWSAS